MKSTLPHDKDEQARPDCGMSMKRYKNELRLDVLTARGISEPLVVDDPTDAAALDKAIIALAGKCLTKVERIAFALAFYCTVDWAQIQRHFQDKYERSITGNTAQAYAERARKKIVERAGTSPELDHWEAAWSRRARSKMQQSK